MVVKIVKTGVAISSTNDDDSVSGDVAALNFFGINFGRFKTSEHISRGINFDPTGRSIDGKRWNAGCGFGGGFLFENKRFGLNFALKFESWSGGGGAGGFLLPLAKLLGEIRG